MSPKHTKVFVLIESYEDEAANIDEIIGVFTTMERAREVARRRHASPDLDHLYNPQVIEYVLDEECL